MPHESDPPRKFYTLKPKEFETVNPPARPPEAPEPGAAAAPQPPADRPIDVRDLFKSASLGAGRPILAKPGESAPAAENDVHAMLKENLARANAAGLNDLAPKTPRKSKRKRDYIIAMSAANPPMVALFLWGLYQQSIVLLVYVGAGIILFNVSLTWIMWFVLDDY